MIKTFNAEERDIRYMLSNKKKYKIPRNQREYVWDKDNLQDLWEDIQNTIVINEGEITDLKEHFLGSCVIMDKENQESFIIDGQQRFTTILTLLSVICEKFKEFKKPKLSDSTYKYIQSIDDYGEPYFLLENDYLNPYFKEAILYKDKIASDPKNEQQKNLRNAFEYFNEMFVSLEKEPVDTLEYITKIRDQILDLKIVEIVVENEVDAYTIFEILNARGKELEIQDLIKNWCMKKRTNTFPTDYIKNAWDEINLNISNTSKAETIMKTFIKHFFVAKYSKFKNEKDLYRYMRKNIKSHNVKEFVDDIRNKSKIYRYISKPISEECFSLMEFKILDFFRKNRVTQIRPILLALYHNYNNKNINEHILIKNLTILYNFHSIYTSICKYPGNIVEKIYLVHANILYSNYSKIKFDNLVNELKTKIPVYEEFLSKFVEKKYTTKHNDFSKHKNAIRHIITDLESFYHEREELTIDRFSIEHILSDKGDDITSQIGNLLPLAKKLNEKAANYPLKDKIKKYEFSDFKLVKNFLKHNSTKTKWTESDIKKRSELMAKLCFNDIWKI